MVTLVKKDESAFSNLAKFYVARVHRNFTKYDQSSTIGQLASINSDLVKDLIPILKETVRSDNDWNARRFAAFNLGSVGNKNPTLVKDIIRVMIDYIKSPFKISKPKESEVVVKGITISLQISDDIDQTQWLKDAYIDTLMFATGNKNLIQPYRDLIETLARNDTSEHTRKKA